MQRLVLTAKMPTYESCIELLDTIRLIDIDVIAEIREGTKCNGKWMLKYSFILENVSIRFKDLQEMISFLVADIGGTSVLVTG